MELERLSFGNNCYLSNEMKHSEQSMHNRSQLLLDDDAMKASARERVPEAGIPNCFSEIIRSGKAQLYLKGCEAGREQYGAFESFEGYDTVKAWLKGAQSVDVCGIAGDYCVKESTANILNLVSAEKVSILCGCVRSIDGGAALDAFIAEKGLGRKE